MKTPRRLKPNPKHGYPTSIFCCALAFLACIGASCSSTAGQQAASTMRPRASVQSRTTTEADPTKPAMIPPTATTISTPTPVATPASSPSPTPVPSTPTPTPLSASPTVTATQPSLVASDKTVMVWVSNASPTQSSRVTVFAKLNGAGASVAGAEMTAIWHYKTTAPTCTGQMDASGTASCTRNIGGATRGYTVTITVSLVWNGQTYTGSASFTPH